MVGETIANEAQAALLDVLLDRVESLLLGDLHLRVGPAGDLDDHVEDAVALIREERDVVERGHDRAILLDEHPVFCEYADQPGPMWDVIALTDGVGCTDEASREIWEFVSGSPKSELGWTHGIPLMDLQCV
jgi:hypothetical protein